MTTDTGAFELHHTFAITPDQLWHLLTDTRMREAWGAPSEDMVLHMEVEDLRVGGIERHRCGPKDAPEFEVETRWYRLDGPSDAAFTETVEIGGAAIATTLVTYRVAKTDAGSELFVHVAVSSFTGPDADGEFKQGWEGGLASLQALAAKVAQS